MTVISHCTLETLTQAANRLRDGHLLVFPTETVYGLGADAENEAAVQRIYQVKGRPENHPLIVHIASINQLDYWVCDVPSYAIALAREFWPGSLTLVLPRSKHAKDFITGGQESVGIRVPAHPLALKLLQEFHNLGGQGIAAPSANLFGKVSPTTAMAAKEQIGDRLSHEDLILDGGPCLVGIESSVIDCTQSAPRILRPGAITERMIFEVTGLNCQASGAIIRVSGALENHYAPTAALRVNEEVASGAGFIALADVTTPEGLERIASPQNIDEYARIFYESLRLADQKGIKEILVVPPAGEGLAVAIRDRIEKARTKI